MSATEHRRDLLSSVPMEHFVELLRKYSHGHVQHAIWRPTFTADATSVALKDLLRHVQIAERPSIPEWAVREYFESIYETDPYAYESDGASSLSDEEEYMVTWPNQVAEFTPLSPAAAAASGSTCDLPIRLEGEVQSGKRHNKGKNPRRRGRRGGRGRAHQGASTSLAGQPLNFGTRFTTVRRTFVVWREMTWNVKSGTPTILKYNFIDMLAGQTSIADWYDEFKVAGVDVHLDDVTIVGSGGPSKDTVEVRIYSSRENNYTKPTSITEMGRTCGARVFAYSPAQGISRNGRLPHLMHVARPVFDVTGSTNDFTSKWLSIIGNNKTDFIIGSFGITANAPDNVNVVLKLQLSFHLLLRGLQ